MIDIKILFIEDVYFQFLRGKGIFRIYLVLTIVKYYLKCRKIFYFHFIITAIILIIWPSEYLFSLVTI